MNTSNIAKFEAALEAAYTELFGKHPDYLHHGQPQTIHGNTGSTVLPSLTPHALAVKMAAGLATGSAHHVGEGVKRACKAVGIKYTRKAIVAYLKGEEHAHAS